MTFACMVHMIFWCLPEEVSYFLFLVEFVSAESAIATALCAVCGGFAHSETGVETETCTTNSGAPS